MKKLILSLFLTHFSLSGFSQKMNTEPINIKLELQQKTDSLSKLSGKKVIGYLFETYGGKTDTTIFFEENGVRKSMILKTLSKEFPSGDSNRRVNAVSDTTKSIIFRNHD